MTAVRNLIKYAKRMDWIKHVDYTAIHIPLPKSNPKKLKILNSEVVKEIMDNEFGINSFVIARNRLIVRLCLKRGLLPKEIAGIQEEHIHPFKGLAYIMVFGRRNVKRNVMLDEETLECLKIYMIERAHFMLQKKISTKNIFLSLVPQGSNHAFTISGTQAVLRNIKNSLRLKGMVYDLSSLNAQGCRRTAIAKDYEKTNKTYIVRHPELSICGQFGHEVNNVPKYFKNEKFWKKDLKTASQVVMLPEKEKLCNIFSDSPFFKNFGMTVDVHKI
jgi:integrase